MADKKVANSLLALSAAAVLAVYAAGYERTKAAANRFAVQAEERRPAVPTPPVVAATSSRQPDDLRQKPEEPKPTTKIVRPRPAPQPLSKRSTAGVATPSALVSPAPAPVAEPAPVVIAPAPVPEPPPTPPAPPKPVYKDGTYLGWGTSRHGDIQAQVVIEDGRIKAATIAQCLTRYSCNVIVNLPPQVAQRQSPETDYVSGATQSTNAFYYAVVEALSKAK